MDTHLWVLLVVSCISDNLSPCPSWNGHQLSVGIWVAKMCEVTLQHVKWISFQSHSYCWCKSTLELLWLSFQTGGITSQDYLISSKLIHVTSQLTLLSPSLQAKLWPLTMITVRKQLGCRIITAYSGNTFSTSYALHEQECELPKTLCIN